MDFRALPSGDLTLTNLTAPGCLTGSDKALESITLSIRARRITAPAADLPQIDMGGAMPSGEMPAGQMPAGGSGGNGGGAPGGRGGNG